MLGRLRNRHILSFRTLAAKARDVSNVRSSMIQNKNFRLRLIFSYTMLLKAKKRGGGDFKRHAGITAVLSLVPFAGLQTMIKNDRQKINLVPESVKQLGTILLMCKLCARYFTIARYLRPCPKKKAVESYLNQEYLKQEVDCILSNAKRKREVPNFTTSVVRGLP